MQVTFLRHVATRNNSEAIQPLHLRSEVYLQSADLAVVAELSKYASY